MNKLITLLFTFVLLAGISSCIKDNFDVPPTGGTDPKVTVNFSIDSLKKRFSGTNYFINEDRIISAIVTADDKSGSFYKQLIIQDSTGGITLLMEGSNIFNDYPIGRRVFIKLKGLYLVSYKGVLQIAGSIAPDGTFTGISVAQWSNVVLKGTYFHTVAPKVLTINQLNVNCISTLVELDNVEFQTSDAGKPFADGYNKQSVSRVVRDCNGASLASYNSGYAEFANQLTPTGKGKMLAIFSVYNSTPQLLLRNLSDLQLDSVRCP